MASPAARSDDSRGWRILKLAGLSALTLLVSIGLLEAGVRLFFPQQTTYDGGGRLHERHDELSWRRAPNLDITLRREGRDVRMCTSGEGDRILCDRTAPRSCEQNVLVLGDSYVEALAVPYEETVWALLEEDTGACLHVTGVGGYVIGQYLRTLQLRLARDDAAHYDLVILSVYSGNDLHPRAWEVPENPAGFQDVFRWLPEELSFRGLVEWLYPLNQRLESVSHVWIALRNSVRARYYGDFVWSSIQPSRLSDRAVADSVATIRQIHDETVAAEIPLLFVFIPIPVQVLDPTGEKLASQVPTAAGDIDMDLPSRRIMPAVRDLAGIRAIDLLDPLRERAGPSAWGDLDPHFSSEGHRLWFEIMRDDVRELLAR